MYFVQFRLLLFWSETPVIDDWWAIVWDSFRVWCPHMPDLISTWDWHNIELRCDDIVLTDFDMFSVILVPGCKHLSKAETHATLCQIQPAKPRWIRLDVSGNRETMNKHVKYMWYCGHQGFWKILKRQQTKRHLYQIISNDKWIQMGFSQETQ